MMVTAGCNQRSAGIGDIAYVKDLLTEKIVTTKLRCSKFGLATFGWVRIQGLIFDDIVTLMSIFLQKRKRK